VVKPDIRPCPQCLQVRCSSHMYHTISQAVDPLKDQASWVQFWFVTKDPRLNWPSVTHVTCTQCRQSSIFINVGMLTNRSFMMNRSCFQPNPQMRLMQRGSGARNAVSIASRMQLMTCNNTYTLAHFTWQIYINLQC